MNDKAEQFLEAGDFGVDYIDVRYADFGLASVRFMAHDNPYPVYEVRFTNDYSTDVAIEKAITEFQRSDIRSQINSMGYE